MPYIQYRPSVSTYDTVNDILLSRLAVLGTYTLDARTSAADSDGDIKLKEGTVLSTYTSLDAACRVKAHVTGETAIAVLIEPVNLRYGDVSATVVLEGWVAQDLCSDNGTFGTVLGQTITDLEHRIHFVAGRNRI